jgi:uncharacterized protein YktA (UPF0223 family)
MAEVDYIRKNWKEYNILEAIMFIDEMEDQYPSEVRRELKEFMRDGARLFAVKAAEEEEKNFPRHSSSLDQPEVY